MSKGTGISSVSGNGTYRHGASVTVSASASSGYTFSGWSGTYSSSNTSYTFNMPIGDVSLTASATKNSYTVSLTKGTGISSVTGAGTYLYGSSVTVTATASPGYTFSGWSGTYSSSNASYTFNNPIGGVSLTASATPNTNTPYKVYHRQ